MRHSALLAALASTAMLVAGPADAGGRPAKPTGGTSRTYVTSNAGSMSRATATSGAVRNWGSVPQVQLKPPRGYQGSVATAQSGAQASSSASATGGGWSGGGWTGQPGKPAPQPGYPGKPGGYPGKPGGHPGKPGGHDGGYHHGGRPGGNFFYHPGFGYPGYGYPGFGYPGYGGGYYDRGYPGGGEWDGNYTRPVRGYRLPSYFVSDRFIITNFGFFGLAQPPVGYNWVRYYDDAVMIDPRGNIYDTAYDVDWDRGGDYAEGDGGDYPEDRGPPPRRLDDGRATWGSGHWAGSGYAAPGAQYHTTYAAPGSTTTVVIQPATTTTTTTTYIDEVVTRPSRPRVRHRAKPRAKTCCCVCK